MSNERPIYLIKMSYGPMVPLFTYSVRKYLYKVFQKHFVFGPIFFSVALDLLCLFFTYKAILESER